MMPTQQIGLLRTISLEASRLGSQPSLFGLRLCCSDSRLDLKLACHTKWPGQLPLSPSFAYSHFSVRIFELLSGRFSNAKLARMFNSLIFAVVCLCVGVASGRSTRLSISCLGGKVFQLAGGLLVVTLVSPTARSTFSSQNAQNTSARTKFVSSHVEKWHAAVARSTFAVKIHKTPQRGPILVVSMSKNATPLWREAVKMYNTPHVRTTFRSSDVEKLGS